MSDATSVNFAVVQREEQPSPARAFFDALLPAGPTDLFGLIWTLDLADNKTSYWFHSAEQAAQIVAKIALAEPVCNVYFGVGLSPEDFGRHHRCEKLKVAGLFGFWLDVDVRGVTHDGEDLPATREEARSLIARVPVPPTYVLDSGTGLHAHWLFIEPWIFADDADRLRAMAMVARWANTLEFFARARGWTVAGTFDLSRVMRIPGTLNLCKGRCEPQPVTVLEHNPSARYEPGDFEPYFIAQDDDGVESVGIAEVGEVEVQLRSDAEAPPEKLAALRAANPLFELSWTYQRPDLNGDASRYCFSIAAFAVGAGWSDQEIADAIMEFRSEHADDLKLDNPHFWRLTIGKPRAKAAKKEREQRERTERDRVKVERAIATDDATAIYRVTGELAGLTLADREHLIGLAEDKHGRKLSKRQLRRALQAEEKRAKQNKLAVAKPKIDVAQAWDQVVRETARALARGNSPPRLFERGAALTRVQKDEKGRKSIVLATDVWLRGEMGREICYFTITEKYGEVSVPPPQDVARDLMQRMADTLAAIREPPLPPLTGLVELPTLREDGTVLDTPGYDRPTGLYYWPDVGLDVPPVPFTPSPAQVADAITLIDELIGDFPFDSQIDRANAFALLLTVVLRPMVGLVPLAIIDAPQAGTGKSLFSSVIHILKTGSPGVMTSVPAEDDEMRKLLTAALMEGAGILILDNADGVLFHPSLSKALTALIWSDRILGASKTVSVPQMVIWIVNGNNVQLGRDLPRRCFKIRLDARSSKPWDDGREFRHPDLIPWVMQQRGRIIAAILTLCRAWFAAGKPDYGPPRLGSFEAWSCTVGNVLAHVGIAGFLANRDEVYEQSDQDGPQWERFLRFWHEKYGSDAKKLSDVEGDIPHDAGLQEAMPDAFGSFVERVPGLNEIYRIKESGKFKIKLGRALQHLAGRRFGEDGLQVVRGQDPHARVATWKVMVAGSRGSCGSVPTLRMTEINVAHTHTRGACAAHVLVTGDSGNNSRHSPDSLQSDVAGDVGEPDEYAVLERAAIQSEGQADGAEVPRHG